MYRFEHIKNLKNFIIASLIEHMMDLEECSNYNLEVGMV